MAASLERLRALLQSDLNARALERLMPGAVLPDKRNPGFRARRQGNGQPVLEVRYRRGGERRTVKLGTYRRHPEDGVVTGPPKTVRDALERYHAILDQLERQEDPKANAAVQAEAQERRLAPALAAYEAGLERRRVVKVSEIMSLLRRELLAPLGDIPLAALSRAVLVKRIREVEPKRPGTARELRTRAGVFMGWCVDEGLLPGNPLSGWRRPRATRAERIERPGRALADWELAPFWRAAEGAGRPFGPYLLMLLMAGQRRTETALMRWEHVDLGAGEWRIPAQVTKSGRAHRVPLPALCRWLLRRMGPKPRGLVFEGRDGRSLTGWSKRLPTVYAATAAAGMAPWTPHDLRRTMRSGLSALGIDPTIAELLLNHALSGELAQRYDRAERWPERVAAAERWARHVVGLVDEGADHVVPPAERVMTGALRS